VVQAEEWCLFNGDSTVTNSQGATGFDGLGKQLTTNVIDLAGGALTGVGNSVKQLDRIVKLVRLQGGQPSHFFCSFGMQNQINQIVAPQTRVVVENGTTVTGGIHAVNYQSPAGVLPIVGDFFINPSTPYPYNTAGSSGPEGAASSSIYLLQVPELDMVDLMPIGRSELAKIADSVRFFISEYTVLAVSLLRLRVVTLFETIRYIGEGLRRCLRAAGERIPREVLLATSGPRREQTRIALS
jgi:hypothetical protein